MSLLVVHRERRLEIHYQDGVEERSCPSERQEAVGYPRLVGRGPHHEMALWGGLSSWRERLYVCPRVILFYRLVPVLIT